MEGDLQKELEVALNHLESYSTKTADILHRSVIISLTSITQMSLRGIHLNFKKGWVRTLVDRYNGRLFDNNESDLIEYFFEVFVKPFFGQPGFQRGGMVPAPPPSFWDFMMPAKEPTDSEKIQRNVQQILNKLSCYTRSISKNLGIIKFFYGPPEDPNRLPIPFMIRGIVEAIRLILTYNPVRPILSRVLLSIVLALIDFLDGKPNESVLSLAGVLGKNPLLLGLVMKVALGVFATNDQESARSYIAFKQKFLEIASPVTEKVMGKTQAFLNRVKPIVVDRFKSAVAAAPAALAAVSAVAMNKVRSLSPTPIAAPIAAPMPAATPMPTAAPTPIAAPMPVATPMPMPAATPIAAPMPIATPIAAPMPAATPTPIPKTGGSRSDFEAQDMLAEDLHSLINSNPSIICSSAFQESIELLQTSPFLCVYLEMLGIPTHPDRLKKYCESLQTAKISRKTRKRRTP